MVGAVVAATVLHVVANGEAGSSAAGSGFAADGCGEHSPGGYGLAAALVVELVMTAFSLLVILGATDRWTAKDFGPLATGLALALIHLVSIPVTNTSVHPARSTGQAILVAGTVAGLAHRFLTVTPAPGTPAPTTSPARPSRSTPPTTPPRPGEPAADGPHR